MKRTVMIIALSLALAITAGCCCLCPQKANTSEPVWVSRGYCDWNCDNGDISPWSDWGDDGAIAFGKAEKTCKEAGGCYSEEDNFLQ